MNQVLVSDPNKTNLWTIQLSQWRKAKKLNIFLLDTTVKSGIKLFAPEWDWVTGVKSGKLSEEEYTKLYRAKLEQSKITHPLWWDRFALYNDIAIACYCPRNTFCHRHILADMVMQHLMSKGHQIALKGEIE